MASTIGHGVALPCPRFAPGEAPRVLLVCAPFYRHITDMLVAGARAALTAAGARAEVIEVPGALEIPPAIAIARGYDGYVGLGCVIRGATTHYETVCNDSSRGLMLLGIQQGLCIGNGILTCETMEQAIERADPQQMNKGAGAAEAALHLIALRRRFAPPVGATLATGGMLA